MVSVNGEYHAAVFSVANNIEDLLAVVGADLPQIDQAGFRRLGHPS
jgi:hypothetical protein